MKHTHTHCYASDQNHAVQHYLSVIVLKINHDILGTKSTKQAVDCLFVMWQTVKRNVTRFTRLFCCLCPAMYVEYWVALESETCQIVTEILRQTLKNTFFFQNRSKYSAVLLSYTAQYATYSESILLQLPVNWLSLLLTSHTKLSGEKRNSWN